MEIVLLIAGLLIGGVIAWLYLKSKLPATGQIDPAEMDRWRKQVESLQNEKSRLEERCNSWEKQLTETRQDLKDKSAEVADISNKLATANSDNKNLIEKLAQHRLEVEDLQKKFTTEFQNIANKILDEKSHKFTEQNRVNMDGILNPLKEKIKDFEKKVEDTHKESLEKHGGLIEQIVSLKNLNLQMSQDALNLTKALKGESKTQGNWGEVRLEMILDRSGLTKGQEYLVQESIIAEDGKRYQPDVIVKLPDSKHIIVDAKVSLVDYERYCSADDEGEKAIHLRNHINSVKKHAKGLSDKEYHNLYKVASLDFVLMFIPIEAAFNLAFQHDNELYNEALDKHIVIVSTSTLLATLRTIASIWKQENQNKNALEIARQSGDLYDKFKAFVDDLIDVGKKMDQSKEAYSTAMNKLVDGKGNLINRAEKLKSLGARASKSFDQKILDRAGIEEDVNETKKALAPE